MKTINRGDIWIVDFEPAVGNEIRKVRPAVVVQMDGITKLACTLVAPITDWKSEYIAYAWMARLEPTVRNSLKKLSAVDALQTKSLDNSRFQKLIGRLSSTEMTDVEGAIAFCMNLHLQKP